MNPSLHPEDSHRCNCATMKKASRRLTRVYDEALAPAGIGSSQYALLSEIQRSATHQAPTISELADALVMDRTTLTRKLLPLERDGYITVLPSKEDRRSKLVALTPTGKAKFSEARGFWLQAQHSFESAYGTAEAAALRSQLLHIAGNAQLATSMQRGATPRSLKADRG